MLVATAPHVIEEQPLGIEQKKERNIFQFGSGLAEDQKRRITRANGQQYGNHSISVKLPSQESLEIIGSHHIRAHGADQQDYSTCKQADRRPAKFEPAASCPIENAFNQQGNGQRPDQEQSKLLIVQDTHRTHQKAGYEPQTLAACQIKIQARYDGNVKEMADWVEPRSQK